MKHNLPEKKSKKDPYYASRYKWNNDRPIVWKEIVRFLKPYLVHATRVVDLGAGYCDFINNVDAKERIAVDLSPDFAQYVAEGVTAVQSPVTDLSKITSASTDVAFASNLLEHLTDAEHEMLMKELKRILKTDGFFIALQPNYRYSYKTYFDDHTHKKVFSHESFKNFFESHGFDVVWMKPKFLPFSLKSRPSLIPLHPLVVRAYIHSPLKPFAGQMLFVVRQKNQK
jgi:SAM-dependent methyltransferase